MVLEPRRREARSQREEPMFCPKCGAGAAEGQNYCRQCGVNLALVTKAVNLGDTVARGDSGLLPRIRAVMGDLQLDDISRQVGSQLDELGKEIERGLSSSGDSSSGFGMSVTVLRDDEEERITNPLSEKTKEPLDERRARLVEGGFGGLFGGVALMVVLYFFASTMVLKIPPDVVARLPFEVEPWARIAWLLGLLPLASGIGRLVAAAAIRPLPEPERTTARLGEPSDSPALEPPRQPPSVVEHTTRSLDYEERSDAPRPAPKNAAKH